MPSSSSSSSDRNALRRRLRAARRALTPAERAELSQRAILQLLAHPWYRRAKRIALYYPVGSEADTTSLFVAAARDRKQLFLPRILYRGGRLLFRRWDARVDLRQRRHGIPQPRGSARVSTRALDLVLVPLLGFDPRGHRVGSGAGYYDRSFAFRLLRPGHPRLLGFAFACQQVKTFRPGHWDVPLDGVLTELGLREMGSDS